jgi:diguanylate cyclase (GGDEF)-like protein/PAS domain S-box-containing protein
VILVSFIVSSIRFLRREAYYGMLMEKSTDVIVSIDVETSQLTFVSLSVHQVLGFNQQALLGASAELLFTNSAKKQLREILNHIEHTGELEEPRCEMELIRADGSSLQVDMVMTLTQSESGHRQELSADIRDISERKRTELALAELAHKDTLTGLANRNLFIELAKHAIHKAQRLNKKLAVLFVDLDGFKLVNDNFGHDMGDKVLVEVADRIQHTLRIADQVARLGGDEFIVLLEDIAQGEEVAQIADKIIEHVSLPYEFDGQTAHVSASIGISLYPDDSHDVSTLIKQADTAMYRVKKSGKHNKVFYS